MKKFLIVLIKFILFFVVWSVSIGIVEIPFKNPVIWRFWAEFIPFTFLIIISIIFWILDKKRIPIAYFNNILLNSLLGTILGFIWLGVAVIILYLLKIVKIGNITTIRYLYFWIISCFINVVMQELLIRGYLYQLIKKEYNIMSSLIVTTMLFTLLHGGAFEYGIIAVLNIVTMSVFMTVLMEYSQSIILPIMVHFIWNSIGCLLLGVVRLASDYPSIYSSTVSGNKLLTAGMNSIEGSIVVLFVNIIFIAVFMYIKKKNIFIQNK